jgi:hypothetical protein
MALRSGY